MTKDEFINTLKEIAKEYGHTKPGTNIYPFFERVKKVAFSYNIDLFFHAFDNYLNAEQAADIIRRQATLEDMLDAVYDIGHPQYLCGLYKMERFGEDEFAVLSEGCVYDVLEDMFKLLGEPCPRWYGEDDEDNNEDNDDDDEDDS